MEKRYQIIYSKSGLPMTTWASSLDSATATAARLTRLGYEVTVAEHTKDGSKVILGGIEP